MTQKSTHSGCCSADSETSHDHQHEHENGEFSLKREGILVGTVIALFILGLVFEEPLHNTPFTSGEYLVFIPAYLLSG